MSKKHRPKNLQDLRRSQGMEQAEVARRMDPPCSANYISQLECGRRNPMPGVIRRLAGALGVSTERVFDAIQVTRDEAESR